MQRHYVAGSSATKVSTLYDPYVRAIRLASNRIQASQSGGVVAFVTNGGFIDSNAFDGFRKAIAEEFHSIYCFNLRGDQRTSGEKSRQEGGKIFGSGSRAGVAILLLVKKPGKPTFPGRQRQLVQRPVVVPLFLPVALGLTGFIPRADGHDFIGIRQQVFRLDALKGASSQPQCLPLPMAWLPPRAALWGS